MKNLAFNLKNLGIFTVIILILSLLTTACQRNVAYNSNKKINKSAVSFVKKQKHVKSKRVNSKPESQVIVQNTDNNEDVILTEKNDKQNLPDGLPMESDPESDELVLDTTDFRDILIGDAELKIDTIDIISH